MELKTGDVMGWEVFDLSLSGDSESILECVGEICDTNGEVVIIINGNIKMDSRRCNDQGGVFSKVNTLFLWAAIVKMKR